MNLNGIVKIFSRKTENGVTQETEATAFFVAPGLLLTCNHALSDAQKSGSENVAFKFAAQTRYQSVCIKISEEYDLALLKTDDVSPPVIYGMAAEEQLGEEYCLAGFHFGSNIPEIMSAKLELVYHEEMKFAGGVRPGSSGGPILNGDSQVVGIIYQSSERQTLGRHSSVIMQEFGEYIAQPSLGERNFKFGEYLWRVLDIQDSKALLLSEEILEKRRYHNSRKSTWKLQDYLNGKFLDSLESMTWEECELRDYLNGKFLQTFTASQQGQIVPVKNANPANQWYGTPGGNPSVDMVFLLSIDEVVKYFGDSGHLKSRPNNRAWISDQYNGARKASYRNKPMWWWLRSPGISDNDAASVGGDGSLNLDGSYVVGEGGVRPALWLNLQSGIS